MKEVYLNNGKGFIEEILGGFYHLDTIQTSGFEVLDMKEHKYRIFFNFLPYKKVKMPLSHVSANQIHEAIMEALYIVTGSFVKSGAIDTIGLDDFLAMRSVAIFREFEVKYKKEIRFEEQNYLDFHILNYKDIKGKFSSIEIEFSGFCIGKTKLVVTTSDLVDNVLDQ